jgi:hypothetical protein
MEYDIDGGNFNRKGPAAVDQSGIAWVSGKGGVRGLDLFPETTFQLDVADVTPDLSAPMHSDWFLA